MTDRSAFLTGAGFGAALMYVLDPERGRRRRALARDKLVHVLGKSEDTLAATGRDMANRARGVLATARTVFERETDVPDVVLAERVRSALGHYCSHPKAIEVTAARGRVTLRGAIVAHEAENVLRAVRRIRGVSQVENDLEPHDRPDEVPALQGGGERTGRRFELLQSSWSPTARVLVGAGGTALLVSPGGWPLAGAFRMLGLGMLARAAANVEMKRLVGVGGGRRAIEVDKSLTVNAPPETAFAFWNDYQNFPSFMANVREVRDLGGGRSHWKVMGPAGVPVAWEAEITQLVPNELVAWKTVPGSSIEHAGMVRFHGNPDGTTRLDIHLSYNPPAGALGHGIAALFGADPKSEIDTDLARMKTLIEARGRVGGAGEASRELTH